MKSHDLFYFKQKQTNHFSLSGGGISSGADGDTSMGGVRGVELPTDDPKTEMKNGVRIKVSIYNLDPYARKKCNAPIKKLQF